MTMLWAALLGLAGLCFLALALERHHDFLAPGWRAHALPWRLRAAGAILLGSSCAAAVASEGPARGLITWLGLLTPASACVAAALAGADARRRRAHPRRSSG